MSPSPYPGGIERRSAALDIRTGGAGRKLAGYAAVFGAPADIGNGVVETIAPGAFRETLASGRDVLALVDHDSRSLLARTSSGTLRLWEDNHGLAFEIDLPETTLARDLRALAERRDLGGMSFSFTLTDEARPAPNRRILRGVTLYEVSVIQSFPAYPATSVSVRSRPMLTTPALMRLRRIAECM